MAGTIALNQVSRRHRMPVIASSCVGALLCRDPFCTGEMRSFRPVFNGGVATARDDAPVGITVPGLVSFGEAGDGRLYIAQLSGTVSALEQTSTP